MKMIKKKGFTLAEVLITLGVIGIVAALTMPSLVAKTEEKENVSKLKKVYSAMSQAYMSAINENGSPVSWGIIGMYSPEGAQNILDKISPYLKVTKLCGFDSGCFPNSHYLYLSGDAWYQIDTSIRASKLRLADGTSIAFEAWYADCNPFCGKFFVDVNGDKKPNTAGRDLFAFYLIKDRIIPYGGSGDIRFEQACIILGEACTAWVIYNENMDYLHCPDKIGWDKAKSCKEAK